MNASDRKLRSGLIRLAATYPKGSKQRRDVLNLIEAASNRFEEGDLVHAGSGEDYDWGHILEIKRDEALVAWNTQVKTWTPLDLLEKGKGRRS